MSNANSDKRTPPTTPKEVHLNFVQPQLYHTFLYGPMLEIIVLSPNPLGQRLIPLPMRQENFTHDENERVSRDLTQLCQSYGFNSTILPLAL